MDKSDKHSKIAIRDTTQKAIYGQCNVALLQYCDTGCFFPLVPPLKVQRTKKLIYAWLGVSKPFYVNVDSPNLGFPYLNFLGGYQQKKHPVSQKLGKPEKV